LEQRDKDTEAGVYRWLVLITLLTTYALIVLGGVVRATGSGDACPDWPRCHGELIPPFETAVMIEFSHRLVASVVGFMVLALVFVAWRTYRDRPFMIWGSVTALVLVVAQAILGGMAVLNDLHANIVMAHLALASTVLALLIVLTFAAWTAEQSAEAMDETAVGFRTLALVTALATFGLLLTGAYVAGSGAGLAFRDWPLFDGQLMPDGGRLAMIHATHRFAAAMTGILIGFLALRAWQTQRKHRAIVAASLFALGLVILQALVGAINVWTLMQPAAMASHLALAVGLWATLVGVTLHAHLAAEGGLTLAGRREPSPARPDTALGRASAQGS